MCGIVSGRYRFYLVLFILMNLGSFASTQSSTLTINVLPSLSVPLGPVLKDGLGFYTLGGGGTLRREWVPGGLRWLFTRASLDYEVLPINNSAEALSLASGGGSLGLSWDPVPALSLRAFGGGGLYLGLNGNASVRNPFWEAGADIQYWISPSLAAQAGARLRTHLVPGDVLYQGLVLQIGLAYDLAGDKKGSEIRLEQNLNPVYPLFYSFYDKNPLGSAKLTNLESLGMDRVKISFFARQYMDGPRVVAELETLSPGTSAEIPVTALFNNAIFRVTEGTKAAGEIQVEYFYLGQRQSRTFPVTLNVQNRNAMTWDDDRKAAAFITAKDPLILGFSKNMAATVRADRTQAVSTEFRIALGLFQALKAYGLGYAVDPSTPFTALSAQENGVDFLQFPNQTLAYRAGDCDDLSVLFAALLESVGIESALITTPGHIFVAFESGLSVDSALKAFSDPSQIIIREDKVWIPVEVTMVKDGFLRAWNVGAQEWHGAAAQNETGFYPVREAWNLYEPVGFAEGGGVLALPAQEKLNESYKTEMDKFSRSQISARVAELQTQLRSGRNWEKTANRLGILYAQFGFLDDARAQFQGAISRSNYPPALVNMGNVDFLEGQGQAARGWYEKALKSNPQDQAALIGLARSLQSLGDFGGYRTALESLKQTYPEVASKVFPEGNTARASSAVERKVESWNE